MQEGGGAPPLDAEVSDAEVVDAGRGRVTWVPFAFDDGGGRAVALVPEWPSSAPRAAGRWPMIVALHGRGEARRGPAEGVMGWPRDYALTRAIERLCAPPLTVADFEGFVDRARLELHNRALLARPYEGAIVLCPYSPDVDLRSVPDIRAYGDYLLGDVIPRARRELPVLASPRAIGIDGVSLGGALALRIGLENAERFGAVGALQPALADSDIPAFTALARDAVAKNPTLALRLTTSSEDFFRHVVARTSTAWQEAGVVHEMLKLVGPHDYAFNRGPGALEMLLWHERVLARW